MTGVYKNYLSITLLIFQVIVIKIHMHISLMKTSQQKTSHNQSFSSLLTRKDQSQEVLDQLQLWSFKFWSKNRTGLDL